MTNEHTLQRFLDAQATAYPQALAELKAGRKRGHWMWYIFPQIQGLGFSSTSQHYAIRDAAEAAAYLAHPVLGPRLREISGELLKLASRDASRVFGSPDDLKLRSSMTLFAQVPGADPVFRAVLDAYFGGGPDTKTLELLGL
ncbi:calpastatin [Hymenobacter psoromatis]|nr:calpastatin [Hymenobacter psoromatis]